MINFHAIFKNYDFNGFSGFFELAKKQQVKAVASKHATTNDKATQSVAFKELKD